MKKIENILVVGYGSMGRRRIRLVSELIPEAKFTCLDSNAGRQAQAVKDGYQTVFSLEEGIRISPDAAFVCTSPGHHAEIILQLLNAGIHVFTELNLTADKYDEIGQAAKEHNAVVFMSSTLIYKRQMENLNTKALEPVKVYETEEHIEGYSDNIAEEPYRDEIREFLEAVKGKKARYGLDEDAYVLNIIQRIEQSYDAGRGRFDLESFVNTYVTKRPSSMFEPDILANRDALSAMIHGKSVMVIGGAGSIGSSFIRAVLPFKPAELVVVDTNENALTELTRSLRASAILSGAVPDIYLPYPMDYSSVTFFRMFTHHKRSNGSGGFDIVANFSAHKHVRSEKDIYSVEALLRNNVIYAQGLLELLEQNPPETYFCVSTDKAANPVNIMGASKRIMEDLIFSYSGTFPVKTARFANVAFSNGSLPAGFLERIRQRQPLSAPSDVKRYFVSLKESGQICMLSAMLGENRSIFFPKLEEAQMATFDRIAEDLLAFMGYEADYCLSDAEAIEKAGVWTEGRPYPVHFGASDTSGEKAFEEFYVEGESVDVKRFSSVGVITNKAIPDRSGIIDLIRTLDGAFESQSCSKADVVRIIGQYLPNFGHIETGRSLDGKM